MIWLSKSEVASQYNPDCDCETKTKILLVKKGYIFLNYHVRLIILRTFASLKYISLQL